MSVKVKKAVLVDEGLKNLYVCRTCLATNVKFLDIFQLNLDKLFRSIGISVSLCDNFPRYICTFCWSLLKKSAEFHAQSQIAHNRFLKLSAKGQFSASEINKLHKNLKLNLTKVTQHGADIPPANIVWVETEDLDENETSINKSLNKTNVEKNKLIIIEETNLNETEIEIEVSTTDLDPIDSPISNECLNEDHTEPAVLALPIDPLKCDTDITDPSEYRNEKEAFDVDFVNVHETDINSDAIEINDVFNENDSTVNFTAPKIQKYDRNKSLNKTKMTETNFEKNKLIIIEETKLNETEIEIEVSKTDLVPIDSPTPNECLNKDRTTPVVLALPIDPLKCDTDITDPVEYRNEKEALDVDFVDEINVHKTDLNSDATEINDVFNETDSSSDFTKARISKYDKNKSLNKTKVSETSGEKNKLKTNKETNFNETEIEISEVSTTDLVPIVSPTPNECLNEDHTEPAIFALPIDPLKYDTDITDPIEYRNEKDVLDVDFVDEINVHNTDLNSDATEINDISNEADSTENFTAPKIQKYYGRNKSLNKTKVTETNVENNKLKIIMETNLNETEISKVSRDLAEIDLPNEVFNGDHNKAAILASTIGKLKYDTVLDECLNDINLFDTDICSKETEFEVFIEHTRMLSTFVRKRRKNLRKVTERNVNKKIKTSEVSTDLAKTDLNEVLNKDHNPAILDSTLVKQTNGTDLTDPTKHLNNIDIVKTNLCVNKTETNTVSSNDAIDKTNKVVTENIRNGLLKVSREEYLNWLNTVDKKPKLEISLHEDDVEIFMVPNDDESKKKYIVCKKVEKTKTETKTVCKKVEKTKAVCKKVEKTKIERKAVCKEVVKTKTETKAVCKEVEKTKTERKAVCKKVEKTKTETKAVTKKPTKKPKEATRKRKRIKYIKVCDICGKILDSKFRLDEHMTTHTKERRYNCDYCKKNFRTKNYLALHIKRCHLKLRPHKCERCPQTFCNISGLIRHRQIHSEARPYECFVCGKRFPGNANRKQHLENVHKLITKPFIT